MKKYIKNIPCAECGKIGVRCKGVCSSCYNKAYKRSPKGREKIKQYNSTKGVEARKRYLDKKKANKPVKVKTEQSCIKCGLSSLQIIKGFCVSCYHKNRAIEKAKNERREYRPKKSKWAQDDIDEQFEILLSRVKKGVTLSNAYKGLKIDRSTFVRRISPEKLGELLSYKDQRTKYHFLGEGISINEEEL